MVTLPLHRLRSRNVYDKKRLLFAHITILHITWWRNQRKSVSGNYTAENFCLRFRFISGFNSSPNFRKVPRKREVFFLFHSLMTFFLCFVIDKPSRNISEHKIVSSSPRTLNPINKQVASIFYYSVLEIGIVALESHCPVIASFYWKDIQEFQRIKKFGK